MRNLDFHTADQAEPPHITIYDVDTEEVLKQVMIVGGNVEAAEKSALEFMLIERDNNP